MVEMHENKLIQDRMWKCFFLLYSTVCARSNRSCCNFFADCYKRKTWFSFSMTNLKEIVQCYLIVECYLIYSCQYYWIHGSFFARELHAGNCKHSEYSLIILDQFIRQSRTLLCLFYTFAAEPIQNMLPSTACKL